MNEIILKYILFLAATFFCFYIPGKIAINYLYKSNSKLHKAIISLIFGVCLFILVTYLTAWINQPFLYLYILIALFIHYLSGLKIISFSFLKKLTHDFWTTVIILLGSFSQLFLMYFSGFNTNDGLQFVGVNKGDGIRHTAYIKIQELFFPPQQPGLAGEIVRGFHYFYDFMLSRFSLFFNFSVEDLNFRLFPLLIAIIYGLSFYLLASYLTKSQAKIRFIVFFAYFIQSSGFIFHLLNRDFNITTESLLPPIGFMVNPFMVLGESILVASIALIPQIKKSWRIGFIVGILLGVLSQIKVYAGLVGIFCLSIYIPYSFFHDGKKYFKNYFITASITAFITLITYFPNNYGAGGLVLTPLLYYNEFIQRPIFATLQWETKRTIFAQHNNLPRIIILYIQAIGLFYILNMGLKIVMITKIKSLINKEFWQNRYNFLIFCSITFPILIASFFIQSVSAFDSVQFFWVAIGLTSIPTGFIIGEWWDKSNKNLKMLILILVLIFSIPGYLDFMKGYIPSNTGIVIPNNEVNVYKHINMSLSPNEFLIQIPDPKKLVPDTEFLHSGTPIISALSGRSVYFEPGGIPSSFDIEYETRRKLIYNLHLSLANCNLNTTKILQAKIGSKYILTSNKYPCLDSRPAILKTTIESENLNFYIFK